MKKNKKNENNFKNIINKNFNATIISSIVTVILGVLLFFQAENTLKTISYIIGIFLLVAGIATLIKVIVDKQERIYLNTSFIMGIFGSIIGFVLLINPTLLTSILPFCIGVWMIISGAMKVQTALALKDANDKTWTKVMIFAIVVLVLGLLLIINPFGSAVIVTKIIGICLVIYSIADIVGTSMLKKEVKDTVKIIEGEVEEES